MKTIFTHLVTYNHIPLLKQAKKHTKKQTKKPLGVDFMEKTIKLSVVDVVMQVWDCGMSELETQLFVFFYFYFHFFFVCLPNFFFIENTQIRSTIFFAGYCKKKKKKIK